MFETRPRRIASSAISRWLQWLIGRSLSDGFSQVIAITAQICSGVYVAGAPERGASASRSDTDWAAGPCRTARANTAPSSATHRVLARSRGRQYCRRHAKSCELATPTVVRSNGLAPALPALHGAQAKQSPDRRPARASQLPVSASDSFMPQRRRFDSCFVAEKQPRSYYLRTFTQGRVATSARRY